MSDKDSPFHRFRRSGGTQEQAQMLATALRESPGLQSMASEAMNAKDLARISLLESRTRLGQYSGYYREISLSPNVLNGGSRQADLDRLTDVFAHELSHSLNRREMREFANTIERKAYDLAAQPGPRDATRLVREYIDKGREQESLAEIAGINAVVGPMRTR